MVVGGFGGFGVWRVVVGEWAFCDGRFDCVALIEVPCGAYELRMGVVAFVCHFPIVKACCAHGDAGVCLPTGWWSTAYRQLPRRCFVEDVGSRRVTSVASYVGNLEKRLHVDL